MAKDEPSSAPLSRIVFGVAFSAYMVSLDHYIVNIALPTITASFHIDIGRASWISLAYVIAIVSTMLFFGKIADRFGLKRVFVAGYAVYTAGSFLCGVAPGFHSLVLFRFIQGLGGSMLYVGGFAILGRLLPSERRGWGFGILSTAAGFGLMMGAPVGGFLTQYLSWHWVFLVNVPLGVVAIVFSLREIPSTAAAEGGGSGTSKRFDVLGAVLSVTGLFAFVFALNRARQIGWASPAIVASLIVSAITLSLFALNEKKHPDPILRMSVFGRPDFAVGTVHAFAAFLLFAGSNFALPFYLECIQGLTASQTGLVMTGYSIVYLFVAALAGRLSDSFSARRMTRLALASATAACLFFALSTSRKGIGPTLFYLCWLGVSMAFFFSPNNNMVMRSVSRADEGVGSGVFRTFCHLGVLMGVCAYEAVFSHGLPENTQRHHDLTNSLTGTAVLLAAFRNSFLLGGLVGVVGLFSELYGRKKSPPTDNRGTERTFVKY